MGHSRSIFRSFLNLIRISTISIEKTKMVCLGFEPGAGRMAGASVTRKKLPNVFQSSPKMIQQEKVKILTPLQKLPKNVQDLGKLIVAKGFK